MAAGAALPGDLFYPLKRAIERVRLAIAVTLEQEAAERTRLAVRRCEEFEQLAAAGDRARLGAATVALRHSLLAARMAIASARTKGAQPARVAEWQAKLAAAEQEVRQFGLDDGRPISTGAGRSG
jgi:ferric-dicitrate binding protein FerR (iron transport regulator)